MKIKQINIKIREFDSEAELSAEERKLLNEAVGAIDSSYAPYSEFHVGTAVLLENGGVVTAGNQENAAYPSGLCAERVALFYAQSKYPDIAIKTIALTAATEQFDICTPLAPCGACRQVIAEAENRQQLPIIILMRGNTGPIYKVTGIESLLPFAFFEKKLRKYPNH